MKTLSIVTAICLCTLTGGAGLDAQCINTNTLDQATSGALIEISDRFGDAVTVGDFDADGFDDLVVGAPWEDIGTIANSGQIHVHFGTANGLGNLSWSRWTQTSINGTFNEAGDLFGSVLDTGDFDADGYDDLIIGIPSEDVGGLSNGGRVAVKYGSAAGLLSANASDSWAQTALAGNGNQAGDRFGDAVAVGDFDGDGYDDVAISAPDDDIGAIVDSGRVVVMYGAAGGLSSGNSEAFNQVAVNGVNEAYDHFGAALAAGDFNGDGYADLAIGVPREDHSGAIDPGQIQIKLGSAAGLKAGGTEAFAAVALGAVARDFDFLGEYLAAGDLDADGYDDLVIGSPAKNVNGNDNAGMVAVAFGAAGGLVPVSPQLLFTNDAGPQPIAFGINFGDAVAVADLDDDGYDDIIAGAPRSNGREGRIAVFFGNAAGAMTANTRWFSESCMGGAAANDQYFGQVLAAGDFDGDGDRELAAGDFNHDSAAVNQSGAVFIANIP